MPNAPIIPKRLKSSQRILHVCSRSAKLIKSTTNHLTLLFFIQSINQSEKNNHLQKWPVVYNTPKN